MCWDWCDPDKAITNTITRVSDITTNTIAKDCTEALLPKGLGDRKDDCLRFPLGFADLPLVLVPGNVYG